MQLKQRSQLWVLWWAGRDLAWILERDLTAEEDPADLKGHAMVAAQWVLICGESLFKLVCEQKSHTAWVTGSRYVGPTWKSYYPEREKKTTRRWWHTWRDGFRVIAKGELFRLREELKLLSAEAEAAADAATSRLTLRRWRFWRDRFLAIAEGKIFALMTKPEASPRKRLKRYDIWKWPRDR